jgi:small multidrug resistance pump
VLGALALLFAAIGIEVASTSVLPRAQGFHNVPWSAVVLIGYCLSAWLLTLVVRSLPVSVAYAIWAGLGTAAVAVIGYLFLGEGMSPLKLASLALIVIGVVGLNLVGA